MTTRLVTAIFFSGIFLAGCSKSSNTKSNSPATPVVTSPPIKGTVAKTDTLRVIAYNVLNYGNGCQGSIGILNGYFRSIIQYTQPDLLSCEKINTFSVTSGFPGNLAGIITDSVLNTVFPGRYAYATPTNISGGIDMSVLFYNRQKLTYVKTENLLASITDFDLYKLYYNDPNLSITHDTTYLYVVVNHTQSGSSSTTRDMQVAQEMQALRAKFAFFPNLINMGDFNTHSSTEAGYQSIVTSTDTTTVMEDPPFYPDKTQIYPAFWEENLNIYAPYYTTSTRASTAIPDSCGTGGGAKSWYDHIFISKWLANGSNYIQYIPQSYQTIGNDGRRVGVDINSTAPQVNTSAPGDVINALFQFSDKYPVCIKLLVKANRNAYSVADPVEGQ